MRKVSAGVLLALLTALAAQAQGPSAPWRTLETDHFRIHYPAPSEAWTRHMAAQLEAVQERVAAEVGYVRDEVTEVVVMDPAASANGTAWPVLRRPRLVLWTTPPAPDSVLGTYRDWSEILLVHEETHLAHLLRPSRNAWQRRLGRLLPIGPIAWRVPRWVSEGYATLVEGRLTGFGRPYSDLRSAILRRKAQLGELPSYGALSGDGERWYGMSMAYLLGSAYLEWLVERAGQDSLRDLWTRLAARRQRSFDEAFIGVFGDSPSRLYNRFRAELTYRAMTLEHQLEPLLEEGELWQDLSWSTGAPALSPRGDRLALVLRSRDRPSRLAVFSTAPDEEAERRFEEDVEELLRRDPLDVPSRRRDPLPREPLFELPSRDGASPHMPRFMPDGRSLLFVRFEPDPQGFLHPDLFRWTPESGRVERLTWGADLREPDPAPDGDWAVAVRQRSGLSQLVRVELASGEVTLLTEAEVAVVYERPRISPDGKTVAFVRHRDGAWRLVARDLASGLETLLPMPERATVTSPAWSADGGSVFAVVGEGGLIDIRAFPVDGSSEPRQVTRTHGAALAPAPTPDGRGLFFLSLEADGLDLRRLELEEAGSTVKPLPEGLLRTELAPALTLAAPSVDPPSRGELGEDAPYGMGRQELLPLIGGASAPSGRRLEVGARSGDVVGRLDLLALLATADGGEEGGALALAWRGWPITLKLQAFAGEELPSEQPEPVPGLGRRLDVERRGLELSGAWRRLWRRGEVLAQVGGYLGEVEPLAGAFAGRSLEQRIAFADLHLAYRRGWGDFRLKEILDLDAQTGETGQDGWHRFGGRWRLEAGWTEGARLGVSLSRRAAGGAVHPFDRLALGGLPSHLVPRSAASGRLSVPALPAGVLIGDDYEGQRVDVELGSWPVVAFYERHRLWVDGSSQGAWLDLRGLELTLSRAPFPLLRLPAFNLRLGVAEVLDPPFEGDIEGWFALEWKP